MLSKTQVKSHIITIYHKFIDTATEEQVAFVDSVYDLCERHYEDGGDTIVECYEPAQILAEFTNLDQVRERCGLYVEQATNFREGTDNDPELATAERFRTNWN